jgi:CDP-glucose 4,6-dehydratase
MHCGYQIKPHGSYGMRNNIKSLKKFWNNKKVFLTGHTGFKGAWLSIFLKILGAKVTGYSLKPNQQTNFFDLANIKNFIDHSIIGDIRDYSKLKKSIYKCSPDFVVHMAAQSLVRHSYENPKYTYEVNTLGTVNILDILNELNFIKAGLIITTDKVYLNKNKNLFFREQDRLGGVDPYSSSKACAELVVNSYINSFLKNKKIFVASVRAGNVIGGGDFSKDRIIPDYFRSFKDKKIVLRSPNSIRPWQHVLDPLYGYLLLLMKLYQKKEYEDYSWNFGPKRSNNKSVLNVVHKLNGHFNNSIKIIKKPILSKKYYESSVLMLDSTKARKTLGWEPRYDLKESLILVANWYKSFLQKKDLLAISKKQINSYFK